MRKALGLVGATLLFAGPALAADLNKAKPVYKAPPLVPVFSWAGWYIGGNAGYGWGNNTDPVTDLNFLPNLKPKGFIGGGQIGYDWQINNWVLGLVADFQGADIKESGANTLSETGNGVTHSLTEAISQKLDFLGTGRVRVGWAMNNWLFYGSGGFAYGDVRSTLDIIDSITENGLTRSRAVSGSHTETRGGWAAGGGVNYALTPNWIVGVDYLHYDLGHTSVTTTVGGLIASQNVAGDIVRGVINYKF